MCIADRRQKSRPECRQCGLYQPRDEVADGHPGLGLGGKAAAVQALALESGEEALAKGVVVESRRSG